MLRFAVRAEGFVAVKCAPPGKKTDGPLPKDAMFSVEVTMRTVLVPEEQSMVQFYPGYDQAIEMAGHLAGWQLCVHFTGAILGNTRKLPLFPPLMLGMYFPDFIQLNYLTGNVAKKLATAYSSILRLQSLTSTGALQVMDELELEHWMRRLVVQCDVVVSTVVIEALEAYKQGRNREVKEKFQVCLYHNVWDTQYQILDYHGFLPPL